jgi:hypothetical protein
LEKKEIDQLYHLLRRASNITDEEWSRLKTTLTPQEQVNIFYGLARHLLAGGDYLALVQYSQFYGECFLVDPVFNAIKKARWEPSRIVEFGAGLGWLSRGLAAKFGLLPTMLVDKRPWPLINVIADLETKKGVSEVSHNMKKGDIIVMCDVLHCLDDPYEVMANFSRWSIAILEYMPSDDNLKESYSTQILRYGASPIGHIEGLDGVFPGRKSTTIDLDPYILLLVEPGK